MILAHHIGEGQGAPLPGGDDETLLVGHDLYVDEVRKLRNAMTPTKPISEILVSTAVTLAMLCALLAAGSAWTSASAQPRPGYLIVRFQPGYTNVSTQTTMQVAQWLLLPGQCKAYGKLAPRGVYNARLAAIEERLLRTAVVRYSGPADPITAAAAAMKDPAVDIAEPWYIGQLHAVPNDPLVASQQALTTIRMSQAWDVQKGAANVVIAISDNGIDQQHEDLQGSLWTNTGEIPDNLIDDDNNGYVDDYQGYNFTWQEDGTAPGSTMNYRANGHGTRVAGIACATTNNGVGMAGIAWNCKMLPLKTARADQGGILYGYQSLMYAAQMGARVVNCSWGVVKPPSVIDQDVVDYCTELGTLIVASAGNHGDGTGGLGWQLVNFPSGYAGVLGVGETTPSDAVVQSSGLGINARVMAPGNRAITTEAGGGYVMQGIMGTSFAAPIVSGVAALVAAQHPALTPQHIAALIEETSNNIDAINPGYATVLPGRVNAEAALRTAPESVPALRIIAVERRHLDGRRGDRFANGDTLQLWYTVRNELGPVGAVEYRLRIAEENRWQVGIPTSVARGAALPSGASERIGPFRIIVQQQAQAPCILDLTANIDGNERSMLDYIKPSSTMGTFENNELLFSAGDDGTFGYNNTLISRTGNGFVWKEHFNLLSPSGLIFMEGGSRALKAFDNLANQSEFVVEKAYVSPDTSVAIITDSLSGKNIGVRINTRWTFPSVVSTAAVLELVIENRGTSPLQDVAAGYYLDWDVATVASNSTRLVPEALPAGGPGSAVAQLFEHSTLPVAVVCAAATSDPRAEGQAAGMLIWEIVDDADGMTDADVIRLLSSGTAIQTTQTGDVSGVLGMRFPGSIAPGEQRRMMIVIGIGTSADQASAVVRETLLDPMSVIEDATWKLYPNPASNHVTVSHREGATTITVTTMMGAVVHHHNPEPGSTATVLDLGHLAPGMYVVRCGNGVAQQLVMLR